MLFKLLRTFSAICLLAAGAVDAHAQAAASTEEPQQQPASAAASAQAPKIRINRGDLVEMTVYGVPDLSTKDRISDSGEFTVPLLQRVHIEGMTIDEAQQLIEKELAEKGFLKNPHVTLTIAEFTTQGISVMGEVARPGIYPLLGQRRLFDVIAAAGGATQKAGRLITITHRDSPQMPMHVELSDDPAKSTESNVEIWPGDTVVVSKAGIVYVVGDVTKPGGFLMDNNSNLSVMQAVALAQGAKSTAKLDKAKIVRKGPDGVAKEIPVDLNKMFAGKGSDVAMQNDDILFIPGSAAKGAARRGLEAILQAATGLAVYGPK